MQAGFPLLALAVGGALTLAGCGDKNGAAADDPVPNLLKDAAAVERGQSIFVGTCGAYCHKMTDTPADAPYLFDCGWLHGGSDKEIFNTITHGVPKSRMVAFAGAIADEDIWKIVAYLKSASQCPS
jgi:mono/diheme cytochrome c family protein